MNNKKAFLFVLVIIILLGVITAIYFSFFRYELILGNVDDVERIGIEIQLADGKYKRIDISDSEEVEYIFELITNASKGKKDKVRLYPEHGYTKDSYITFFVEYEHDFQIIHIGYDNKIIYEIKPQNEHAEYGYVIISCDSVAKSLIEHIAINVS